MAVNDPAIIYFSYLPVKKNLRLYNRNEDASVKGRMRPKKEDLIKVFKLRSKSFKKAAMPFFLALLKVFAPVEVFIQLSYYIKPLALMGLKGWQSQTRQRL